jgi:CO/xanthine dehydrogenase FAD-binding subunit
MNAVLGVNDHCIAAHPSDMAAPMTAVNAPPKSRGDRTTCRTASRAEPALNTDEAPYFGFPVAFVVAESF